MNVALTPSFLDVRIALARHAPLPWGVDVSLDDDGQPAALTIGPEAAAYGVCYPEGDSPAEGGVWRVRAAGMFAGDTNRPVGGDADAVARECVAAAIARYGAP